MLMNLYCNFPASKIIRSRKRWGRVILWRFMEYSYPRPVTLVKTLPKLKSNPSLKKLLMLQRPTLVSPMNELSLNTFWFFLYQQLYFSHIYKTPILLKNMNAIDVVPYSILKYLVNSVKHVRWKRYSITHSNEIIEILFISLWLKNLKLFMEWVRTYFEKANLKKHRKLFSVLILLLGRFIWSYNIFLGLQGLRVSLIGKFGKAGSVRKTRRYIKRGKCSYTTKKIALVSQTILIKTLTGVFSIKFEVFY